MLKSCLIINNVIIVFNTFIHGNQLWIMLDGVYVIHFFRWHFMAELGCPAAVFLEEVPGRRGHAQVARWD